MQRFTDLYTALDETNRTNEKVAALEAYFRTAPAEDAAWALAFLTGRSPVRAISTTALRAWAAEATGLPPWLVDECYTAVGDIAEALALITDPLELEHPDGSTMPLHELVAGRVLPLRGMTEAQQRALVLQTWRELTTPQRFVWHKLITGALRVGVGRTLVVRALSQVAGVEPAEMAHRVMGAWEPTAAGYRRLLAGAPAPSAGEAAAAPDTAALRRPYPFYLAYQLDAEPAALGDLGAWQVEWKWDGIRAQVIRRGGEVLVWTRGEELVTDVYPEIAALGAALPDGTAVDGEIVAWREERPLPFQVLQQRIGRKKVDAKLLRDAPVILIVYDLLEWRGADVRAQPLTERRALLAGMVGDLLDRDPALAVRLSPLVEPATWAEAAALRAESRARGAEGFMLKRRDAPYGVGRRKGDWWKWKIDPYSVDAVMIYAQAGHGRRAGIYTDYTFAVWHEGELVPIAKAYSGLTDEEIRQVDAFVRRNTVERFGPVRSVKPELVFELGFEGIQPSTRHKSGIALRFPRILRRRHDKRPEEADSLAALRALLTASEQ